MSRVTPEERAQALAEMERLLAEPLPIDQHPYIQSTIDALGPLTLIKSGRPAPAKPGRNQSWNAVSG